MSTHAFVDESFRDGLYLLAATLVPAGDVRKLRTQMRGMLLPGQRELHLKGEKGPRRRQLLDQVVATGAQVSVYTALCTGRDQENARALCLHRLVTDLAAARGQRLILDSRPGRDNLDARTIRAALAKTHPDDRLSWEHLDSISDPLIWISDAVCWAYGAGGDWRRRIEPALAVVVDCR